MNLLLTLGHNSSAIWTDGTTVIGYEQERISRLKSDSRFPVDAINEIFKTVPADGKTLDVFVSHWFDCKSLKRVKDPRLKKYWDFTKLKSMAKKHGFKDVDLHETTGHGDFHTHHDAHAWSAVEFYRQHLTEMPSGEVHILVCDGFGNHQEVFSVYSINPETNFWAPYKIAKSSGYTRSLGLMYQYATSFCGMKENQDEYKFLGYESHIHEVLTKDQIRVLRDRAQSYVGMLFVSKGTLLFAELENEEFGDFIDIDLLLAAKENFNRIFQSLLNDIGVVNTDGKVDPKRVIIGHFVQCVIENYYSAIIDKFGIKNVIVTGGVHYNVKLNHHILSNVEGQFCAVPLAGDQGAAIGVYAKNKLRFPFANLRWGKRSLSPNMAGDSEPLESSEYIWTDSRDAYINVITELIKQDRLVNTITGWMEFGPRALCNTSTLAKATVENVRMINELNGRDTVMPFAPVISAKKAQYYFESSQKRVVGSLKYMVTTLDYTRHIPSYVMGVAHPYPGGHTHSGRPQIVGPEDTSPIADILEGLEGGPIINTSLNVHGVPIVFSLKDAIADMRYNVKVADSSNGTVKKPVLVVGNF